MVSAPLAVQVAQAAAYGALGGFFFQNPYVPIAVYAFLFGAIFFLDAYSGTVTEAREAIVYTFLSVALGAIVGWTTAVVEEARALVRPHGEGRLANFCWFFTAVGFTGVASWGIVQLIRGTALPAIGTVDSAWWKVATSVGIAFALCSLCMLALRSVYRIGGKEEDSEYDSLVGITDSQGGRVAGKTLYYLLYLAIIIASTALLYEKLEIWLTGETFLIVAFHVFVPLMWLSFWTVSWCYVEAEDVKFAQENTNKDSGSMEPRLGDGKGRAWVSVLQVLTLEVFHHSVYVVHSVTDSDAWTTFKYVTIYWYGSLALVFGFFYFLRGFMHSKYDVARAHRDSRGGVVAVVGKPMRAAASASSRKTS